jgi:hypothetical protein
MTRYRAAIPRLTGSTDLVVDSVVQAAPSIWGISTTRSTTNSHYTWEQFLDDCHFANSDSQSCSTTRAELSPGVIEGITKRLPSAETSNETTE